MSQFNPVVWFEIYVSDMARAEKFYSEVLGIEFSDMPLPEKPEGAPEMQMSFFPGGPENNGAAGALVHMEGAPVGTGGTMVYFHSEDCSEETRIEAAGGKVFQPKMSLGEYGFITIAKDTEGNMFGLHSMQ